LKTYVRRRACRRNRKYHTRRRDKSGTMKMPRRFNTHCPHCNAHHEHEVERVQRGRETGMKWIDRQRDRNSGIGNDGKFSKVPGGNKPTKKTNLIYRCTDCGKAHGREGWRAGKLELEE
jgi:large subunit ribosomal protein L44e